MTVTANVQNHEINELFTNGIIELVEYAAWIAMLNNTFEIGEELHKNKEILRIRFCTKTSTNVPNEAIIIIVFIFRIKSDETVLLSMPTEVTRGFVFAQSLEIHWHLFRRKSSNTKTNCKIKRIRSLDRPVRLMPNIVYIILNENINFRIIKWCEPCVLINLYAYFSRFTCHQQKAILTKRKLTVNTFLVASIFVCCYSAWK